MRTLLSNHELIVQAGGLRQRVSQGAEYRRLNAGDEGRWKAATDRWHRLTEQYLHAVSALLVEIDPDTLTAARDELTGRLERGFEADETEDTLAHFGALLGRYEAVCDALDGLTAARKRLTQLDRMATVYWLDARRRADLDSRFPAFRAGGAGR